MSNIPSIQNLATKEDIANLRGKRKTGIAEQCNTLYSLLFASGVASVATNVVIDRLLG